VERLHPAIELTLGLLLGEAIALLDLAQKLLALAVDVSQIVIGQARPLLPRLAFDHVPLSFDLLPVHGSYPPSWPASRSRGRVPILGTGQVETREPALIWRSIGHFEENCGRNLTETVCQSCEAWEIARVFIIS
jgi:hypothetical protein